MADVTQPPQRAAVLAQYRPIRAAIQAVLDAAVDRCRKPDFDRAAKHLDLVDRAQLESDGTVAMLSDIALFEPNQRGRRVIDRFVEERADALPEPERAVARRLPGAFFSIFRIAGWHEAGGVWLEDLLAARRIWLMDENLEASAPEGLVIGLRVFDAGPFHAGFGIVVHPDAEAVAFCTSAAACGKPMPVRHSLAAALYGDAIAEATMPATLGDILEIAETLVQAQAALAPPARKRRSRAKRGGR